MYIAALSVRLTGWLWFEVEPLSFYRWGHADQMSRRVIDDTTFQGLVWTLGELAADPHFAIERSALVRQLAKQETLWSLHALLRKKHPAEAVRRFSQASREIVAIF